MATVQKAVSNVTKRAGKAVSGVASGAGKAVAGVASGAGEAVTGVAEGAGKAVAGVASGAKDVVNVATGVASDMAAAGTNAISKNTGLTKDQSRWVLGGVLVLALWFFGFFGWVASLFSPSSEGFFGDGRTGNVPMMMPMNKYTQEALRYKDQELWANAYQCGEQRFVDNVGLPATNCHAYTYPPVYNNPDDRYSNSFQTQTYPRPADYNPPRPSEDLMDDENVHANRLYQL